MYTTKNVSESKINGEMGPSSSFVAKINSKESPLIGAFITIPSITIAQLTAQSGCDFAIIDMEHAPFTIDIVTQMVHAFVSASRGTSFPLVRIPSHGVEWVKWALDSGAAGIIIPMVNNANEMESIIDRAIYPPAGRRSFGPFSAPFGHPEGPHKGLGGYFERAINRQIAVLPMIESKEGLENVESILALDDVTGAFIGPADLRLSLGLTAAADGPEPLFLAALQRICAAAQKHNKVVGCLGLGEEDARKRSLEGMDFLVSTFDYGAMNKAY
ncbi:MAG: HpcH/HpaI aldolase family protein, partial [Janthinobacterium lividum]